MDIKDLLPSFSERVWRLIAYLAAALVLLGVALFAADRISNWRTNRAIEGAKTNLNIALKDLANVKTDIAVDRDRDARAVENVKVAANTLLDAQTASNEARRATNDALAALSNVKASNVNVSVEELQRTLDKLP